MIQDIKKVDPLEKIAFGALLIYVFTIPNEAIFISNSFGSASRIAGIILFVLWIYTLAIKGSVIKPPFEALLFLLFLWFSITSTLWSVSPERTIARNITLTQNIVLMFIMIFLVKKSVTRLKTVWLAYVTGTLATALMIIYLYLTGYATILWKEYERYAAYDQDPNTIAVMLSIGLILSLFLFYDATSSLFQIIYLATAAFLIIGIVLTGSRGGIFTALSALIYPILYSKRTVFKGMALSLALGAAFFGALLFLPGNITGRYKVTVDQIKAGHIETTGRYAYWIAGIKQFSEAPLLGHGGSSFRVVITEQPDIVTQKVAHNVPIQILVDYGILGIILLFTPIGSSLIRMKNDKIMFRKISYLVLIWFLGGLSLSYEANKITWFVFGITLCAVNIIERRLKQARRKKNLTVPTSKHSTNFQQIAF